MVKEVCTNISDGMDRKNNIVVFNQPEKMSIIRADVMKEDREDKICNVILGEEAQVFETK